ncbi:MAG: hypothetical protein IKS28_07515 [Clostridia bacterium]|nr:hypothetical protein [Clostridia bacterium]
MRKKYNKALAVVLAFALIIISTGVRSIAASFGEETVCTVYASNNEQDAFMDAVEKLMPEMGFSECVIPGSVTPEYYYSLYDSKTDKGYKAGDEIVLSKTYPNRKQLYSYIGSLKEIEFQDKRWSGGFIEVHFQNGLAIDAHPVLSPYEEDGNMISLNYADFAEDIRVLTGREEIVDPQYVRLVSVFNVGVCFYINDGADEFFYRCYSDFGNTDVTHGTRIIRAGEDLERAAREVKEYLERERKIQAGEIESGGSSSLDVEPAVVEFHPATGDTSDIEAYLGVKIDSFKTHFPEAFKAPVIWPYFVAGGAAVAVAAAVAVILIAKKRRARASGEAPAEPAV